VKRAVLVIALSATACAAVTGLSDYEISSEAVDRLDGSSVDAGASSSSSGTLPPTDAGDAGSGSSPGSIDCGEDTTCTTDRGGCCVVSWSSSTGASTASSGPACSDADGCRQSANKHERGRFTVYLCDDAADCASGQVCCFAGGNGTGATQCLASCPTADIACLSDSECGEGGTCIEADEKLPSLRRCK
jgi:hypothetical protein